MLKSQSNNNDDTIDDEYLEYSDDPSNFQINNNRFTLPVPKNGTGLPMQIPGPEHINWIPAEPEKTYQVTDTLVAKMVLHDSQRLSNPHTLLNRVVYDCIDPSPMHQFATTYHNSPYFRINRAPGQLIPYYIPMSKEDSTLVFESRFESGNLRRAIQVYEYEYDLILKFDVNTRGHTQWYYFSVRNAKKGATYKFNLINLLKPDSLYNYGMMPLIYSELDAKNKGRGWFRSGENICYYQNNIKRKNGYFFTLTFSYTFENDNDHYYFAYCFPYSYTDLQHYLNNLEQDAFRRKLFRRRTLCQSLAGNNVDLLTITSFSCDPQALKNRKGVVVTGRVHPGESNSSFLVKGVIDFLTGPSVDARILRDNFVFKIIPMINPDGVINGNYRCSLAGVDLNRRYIDPSIKLHPSIYHTKEMIKKFTLDREVILYCDMHGHSRKKNIFMYGCPRQGSRRLSTRIFPRLLGKLAGNFSFEDSTFGISKQKESTGRVVMNREVGIINSYTMEASFCGSSFGKMNNRHYSTKHLEQMGHYFCETILDYCDPDQSKVKEAIRELEILYPENSYLPQDTDSVGSDDEESDTNDASKLKRRKKKSKKTKGSKTGKKQSISAPTPPQTISQNQTTSTAPIQSYNPFPTTPKRKERENKEFKDLKEKEYNSLKEIKKSKSKKPELLLKQDGSHTNLTSLVIPPKRKEKSKSSEKKKRTPITDRPRSGLGTRRESKLRLEQKLDSLNHEIDNDSSNSDDGLMIHSQPRNTGRSQTSSHDYQDGHSDSNSVHSGLSDHGRHSISYQSYQRFKTRLIETEESRHIEQHRNSFSGTISNQSVNGHSISIRRGSLPVREGYISLTPSVYRSDIAMSLGSNNEELPSITRGRSRSSISSISRYPKGVIM